MKNCRCFFIALVGLLVSGEAMAQQTTITVSPTLIDFGTYTIGGTIPASQTVLVTSAPSGATLGISGDGSKTDPGFSAVVPPSGMGAGFTTPATLTVRLAPASLLVDLPPNAPNESYTNTFSIVGPAGSNTPVITVKLTVSPATTQTPTIAVSSPSGQLVAPVCAAPASPAAEQGRLEPDATITFSNACYQPSVTIPVSSADKQAHQVNVTSSNSAVSVSPGSFLVPSSGVFVIRATMDPTGLPKGNYPVTLTLTPDSGPPVTSSQTFTVTDLAEVTASPTSFTLNIGPNGAQTSPQLLDFSTLFGPTPGQFNIQFFSSDCPQNSVIALPASGPFFGNGTASSLLTINPATTLTKSCTGGLGITVAGAQDSGFTMPLSLNVASGPDLRYLVPFSSGYYGEPVESPLNVPDTTLIWASDESSVPIFVGSTPTWATAVLDKATTPATLTLALSPAANSLPPGVYTDVVKISSPNAGNNPLQIPVRYVKNAPLLSALPPGLTFTIASSNPGAVPQSATVNVFGSPGIYNLAGPSFLSFPKTVQVPATGAGSLSINLNPSGVTASTSRSLSFTAQGGTTAVFALPISITSVNGPVVDVLPHGLLNLYGPSSIMWVRSDSAMSGISASAITADGTGSVTTSPTTFDTLGEWMPTAVRVNKPPGTKIGYVKLKDETGKQIGELPVTSNLLDQFTSFTDLFALYVVVNTSENRMEPHVSTALPSQTINLPGLGQSYVAIGPDWLTISPSTGTTPQTLTVTPSSSALNTFGPGSYIGNITIAMTSLNPLTIPVNVVIGTAPAVTVVNAASIKPGPVSPGELISIFGADIGPTPAVGLVLTSTGLVSTTLGNTQVLFDGVPAPLAYAGSGQINAIAPYEIGGKQFTIVVVQKNGTTVGQTVLAVADWNPAIFTFTGTGTGQGAIRNQDNSANGTKNPAAAGSIITIFATGEGPLAPTLRTGSLTTSTPPFPAPIGPVSVTIAGKPAIIQYAGEAPGEVAGLFQLDVTIPPGTPSGSQPVVVTVGNNDNSSQNITVAVE